MTRRPKAPPNERAQWVRRVREGEGLSQDEFAARLGVSRPAISNWERGRYVPEWSSIERILRTFPAAPSPPFMDARDEAREEKRRALLQELTDEGLEVAEYLNPLPQSLRVELRDQFSRIIQLRLARMTPEAK